MTASSVPGVRLRRVTVNGVGLNVATAGQGPAVLLLHGFPHTWRLWSEVIGPLARRHRVIAPDLRGFGASDRPADGYDAGTLATDAEALLDALDAGPAAVVGIDLGTPPAFLLAMRRPGRVRRLVLMESLLGDLPGADAFLAGGPRGGSASTPSPAWRRPCSRGTRRRTSAGSWTGAPSAGGYGRTSVPSWSAPTPEARRCAPRSDRTGPCRSPPGRSGRPWPAPASPSPALTIGAHPVGGALERQLRPYADRLTGRVIPDCGHIIPLDRPDALLDLLDPFLAADD
ncbi:alpha/beta fold hydrolase [Streptomyces tricolor]|nr:alpha/beta fold hydrolase [Streptomyces tricolor]